VPHNASAYIEFPTDYATQRNNIDNFYKTAAFPNVLCCVDGTVTTAPGSRGNWELAQM